MARKKYDAPLPLVFILAALPSLARQAGMASLRRLAVHAP